MKERAIKTIGILGIVFLLGIAYGIFFIYTGIGLPCKFYQITGLKCPGCGITRFVTKCMQLDFYNAIKENYLAPLMFLLVGEIIVEQIVTYIRYGRARISKRNERMAWGFVGVLILWFVVRNIIKV